MTIGKALSILGIEDWVLDGNPVSESEFNSTFKKVMSEDSNGLAVLSSDTSDFGVSWSQIQTALANGGVVAMAQLRIKRNELLAETDWMSASDYTMSDAWTTYRQALRDITSQTPSDNALSNITFPTKPS